VACLGFCASFFLRAACFRSSSVVLVVWVFALASLNAHPGRLPPRLFLVRAFFFTRPDPASLGFEPLTIPCVHSGSLSFFHPLASFKLLHDDLVAATRSVFWAHYAVSSSPGDAQKGRPPISCEATSFLPESVTRGQEKNFTGTSLPLGSPLAPQALEFVSIFFHIRAGTPLSSCKSRK